MAWAETPQFDTEIKRLFCLFKLITIDSATDQRRLCAGSLGTLRNMPRNFSLACLLIVLALTGHNPFSLSKLAS